MENKNLHLIFFSPTGTTKKVANAIADGLNFKQIVSINLNDEDKIEEVEFTKDDMVIIGVPVYAGRVPLMAINRLQKFKANKTKAILVAVYGNRHYDDALLELKNISIELGFSPVAAAVFIGEHSFSSSEYPIAEGRPNFEDLKMAKNFGKSIKDKGNEIKEIEVPGNFPYKERPEKFIVKPKINQKLCNKCYGCKDICSVNAISILEDQIEINEKLCIYCHACVRFCPESALKIDDEIIIEFSKKLHNFFKIPRDPELFF